MAPPIKALATGTNWGARTRIRRVDPGLVSRIRLKSPTSSPQDDHAGQRLPPASKVSRTSRARDRHPPRLRRYQRSSSRSAVRCRTPAAAITPNTYIVHDTWRSAAPASVLDDTSVPREAELREALPRRCPREGEPAKTDETAATTDTKEIGPLEDADDEAPAVTNSAPTN